MKKARRAYGKKVRFSRKTVTRKGRTGIKKAKGRISKPVGSKVRKVVAKKATMRKTSVKLPTSFRLRNANVRDQVYRIANYMGFRPSVQFLDIYGPGLFAGDRSMTCGWPLHLAHDPDGAWLNLNGRMRRYGQVRPLEIGLMSQADMINGAADRVGNHPSVYLLDMEAPPQNVHYSDTIPLPRFQDVGLGAARSMCQIKMKRVQTTIEFGVQPFSLSSLGMHNKDLETADPTSVEVTGKMTVYQFENAAITRNWSDEVRIVQLLVHSDGEICDFDFSMSRNEDGAAAKKYWAERFFDFDDHPGTTLFGDAGARLDFYAPVTGRYRGLGTDVGCSEAFWKVDVLHDQVYQVASSPTFLPVNSSQIHAGVSGDGSSANIEAPGGSRYPAYAPLNNANNGFTADPTDRSDQAQWTRPIVPAGKSDIVVIDYPLNAGLFYSQKTSPAYTVNNVTAADLQVYHCENMQILTFIFSKNSIARPVATRGRGVLTGGIIGPEGPNAINWESGEANAHCGDFGTVAAFFCGKVVKEFEIPDKL